MQVRGIHARRALKWVAVAPLVLLSVFVGLTLHPRTRAATPPAGYYVSPTGSDSAAGTAAAPYATLAKCQTAMRASSTIKTCYVGAGTYHPPASPTAGCSKDTNALHLESQDAGETWSYNPADGYDTAIIDGGSSSAATGLDSGICVEGQNITIDGLQLQHFQSSFIDVFETNATITNNVLHDSYYQPFVAAIKLNTITQGTRVTHNVIYNVASNGISAHSCNGGYGGCAQGISNVTVAYNAVYNYCYNDYDCGAIEFQDFDSPRSTNILAAYNYVRDGDLIGPGPPVNDGGGIGGARALYMDDGASNITYQGNIVTGKNNICVQIHGGNHDIYKNNICDLQPPAANQNVGNTGMSVVYTQESDHNTLGMAGNQATGNIVISSEADGGNGYDGDSTAPVDPAVSNSVYHNYAATPTGSCFSGGIYYCGSDGRDASPQNVSNLFNPCPTDGADPWSFELNSTSPALAAPVSFPQPANDHGVAWGHPGFWGPPGYTIAHTGNLPSYSPCDHGPPPTPTPSPSAKIGDLNNDGQVNIFDLSILLSHWGTADASSDLNHDGTVNVFDLSILLSHWGT